MRRVLMISAALAASSCTTIAAAWTPMTVEQSELVREACGRRPINHLRSSESPREILYRACQRETLGFLNSENEVTDAP